MNTLPDRELSGELSDAAPRAGRTNRATPAEMREELARLRSGDTGMLEKDLTANPVLDWKYAITDSIPDRQYRGNEFARHMALRQLGSIVGLSGYYPNELPFEQSNPDQ